jgi:hypothetical protein
MPQFISLSSILELIAGLSTILGAVHKIRRILKERKDKKDLEKAVILQEAKETSHKHKRELESQIELLKTELTAKIDAISLEIKNIEEATKIELAHQKENYNSEIHHLGLKIDELKDEMRVQVSQIVLLIGKLIDKT